MMMQALSMKILALIDHSIFCSVRSPWAMHCHPYPFAAHVIQQKNPPLLFQPLLLAPVLTTAATFLPIAVIAVVSAVRRFFTRYVFCCPHVWL
jgi:hypothetical protein